MLSSSRLEKVMLRAGVYRRGFDGRRSFRVGFCRSWTQPPLPELSSRAALPRASLIFDADVQAPTAWPVALSHFGAGAGRSGTPAIVLRGDGKESKGRVAYIIAIAEQEMAEQEEITEQLTALGQQRV